MTGALFEEPFNFDDIGALTCLVSHESEKFMMAAVASIGMRERWLASLDQLARLLPQWQERGEDDEPVYLLLAALGLRASSFADAQEFRKKFGSYDVFDIERINATAYRMIEQPGTVRRWYPLPLPLSERRRQEERDWHSRRA